jgi:transposase InsO family protein
VTLEHAAELSALSVRAWRRRAVIAEARGLARKIAPPAGGKPTWLLHRSLHAALERIPNAERRDARDRTRLGGRYPADRVERAYERARWLAEWRARCERDPRVPELEHAAAVVAEAEARGRGRIRISTRSLRRWRTLHDRSGVEGLIDGFKSPTAAGEVRSAAAVECFYSVFRTENKFSARFAHDATRRESKKHGWSWPESYAATTRWLREHDDRSLTFLMRHGKRAWAKRFLPHIEVDHSLIAPGSLFVSDHTQLDLWAEYKGRHLRPWLTALQDDRSRCLVGWHIGPSPHTDAILSAMRRAFRDWAVPERMRIDNGRDFASRQLIGVSKTQRGALRRTLGPQWRKVLGRMSPEDAPIDHRFMGIMGELGIEPIQAQPYSPWAKGTIERFFGTVEDRFAKTFATYCGHDPHSRPESLTDVLRGWTAQQKGTLKKRYGRDWKQAAVLKLVDQTDIPTLDAVAARFADWLVEYHHTPHTGQGMDGKSPLAVWNTATRLRRASPDELEALLRVRGIHRVHASGVRVKIGAATIAYGARSPELKPYVGRDVLVMLDPDSIAQVWVFTPDREKRRLIAKLPANKRLSPAATAEDVREAVAEVSRERKVMHEARRTSRTRTRTAIEKVNAQSSRRLAELRATGTDQAEASPVIVPVDTGFEGLLTAGRAAFDGSPLDGVDPDWTPEEVTRMEALIDATLASPRPAPDDDDEDEEDDWYEGEDDEGVQTMPWPSVIAPPPGYERNKEQTRRRV